MQHIFVVRWLKSISLFEYNLWRRSFKCVGKNRIFTILPSYRRFLNLYCPIKYFYCPQVTIADYACVTPITTAEMFFKVPEKYENLVKWLENCRNLPEFKKANKEGLEELKKLLENFRR